MTVKADAITSERIGKGQVVDGRTGSAAQDGVGVSNVGTREILNGRLKRCEASDHLGMSVQAVTYAMKTPCEKCSVAH